MPTTGYHTNKAYLSTGRGRCNTTTHGLGTAVYERQSYSPVTVGHTNYGFWLQLAGHKEVSLQAVRTLPNQHPTAFVNDYILKDHLGNVRMVLTEEQLQNNYPDATMEDAAIANESKYYSNLYNTKVTKPSWFTDPMYSTNSYVARLRNNSTSQKVGPSILLKVMAGDSYNIRVAAGWKSSSVATNSSTNILSSLVGLLSGSIPPISAGKATSGGLQSSGLGLEAAILGFMQGQPVTPNKPKAYLAWLLFDEQFKVVASGSVLITNNSNPYVLSNLPVKKSGYLFVYTSNEATNIDVFFDNLKVTHVQGPLLEETHYYPFGLTMAGISSKAAGKLENKFKYNGKEEQRQEFSDGSGLEWMDYGARMYDAQIGRFFTQDRFAEYYQALNPFQYTGNNPINFIDENGDYITIDKKDDNGNIILSLLYENGKAFFYSHDKEGNIVKGDAWDGEDDFISQTVDDLNSIASTKLGGFIVSDLQGSKYGYNISQTEAIHKIGFDLDPSKKGGGPISYSQNLGNVRLDKVLMKSAFVLGHELMHAWAFEFLNLNNSPGLKARLEREIVAVEFENYLRSQAKETVMRQQYTLNNNIYPLGNMGLSRFQNNYKLPLAKYFKSLPIQRKLQSDVDNTFTKPPLPILIDTRQQKL